MNQASFPPRAWSPEWFLVQTDPKCALTYICSTAAIFLKKSQDPASGKIVRLKREVGTSVLTTGNTWTGPGGGLWVELEASASEEHGGWALVQGPGFGLRGPALVNRSEAPRCFVFDLDNCVWTPELQDLEAGSPFSYDAEHNTCTALGGRGERVSLLGDVSAIWEAILAEPRFLGARIAIASCCSEGAWANELLGQFQVGGRKMRDCVAQSEIHSGSKQEHLREIAAGLGVALEDMVFFDDRAMHCQDVIEIGVVSVEVPVGGVTYAALDLALEAFARRGLKSDQSRGA